MEEKQLDAVTAGNHDNALWYDLIDNLSSHTHTQQSTRHR